MKKDARVFNVYVKLHNKKQWRITNYREYMMYTDKRDNIVTIPTVEEIEKIQSELKNVRIVKKHFSDEKKVIFSNELKKVLSVDNNKLAKCGGVDILFSYKQPEDGSMDSLCKHLPADDFIEYLKDREAEKLKFLANIK